MKANLVCFSPTGGTRLYGKRLAKEIDPQYTLYDLTKPDLRGRELRFGPEELVILAAPVYGGRLPELPDGLFDRVRGEGTPALLLVAYGNRAYEDALLELADIASAQGFSPAAAGAFVARHSYSDLISGVRPDKDDLQRLDVFAAAAKEKLQAGGGAIAAKLPGSRPYKPGMGRPAFMPEASGLCDGCGRCVSVCPMGAIAPGQLERADPSLCINCYACVRFCPRGARAIPEDRPFWEKIGKIAAACGKVRREPEWFL